MNYDPELFDAELYAKSYPDVALSGLPPRVHFERYGRLLGRDPGPKAEEAFNVGAGAGQRTLAVQSPLHDADPSILDRQYAEGIIRRGISKQHDELVSIIIPSYNNEPWILRAIYSALSQEGVNIEVLVVDDGSTDGSVAVARKVASDNPNMRVISLLRNFGCYYARNIGVLHAKGAYITIIDSDDIVTPDRILRQLSALKASPGAVAARCHQRRWSADFTKAISELKPGENSLIWRRDLLKSIGWYDSVRFSADAEFRLRIQRTLGAESVVILKDELYFLRTLQGSLTTSLGSQVYSIEGGKLNVSLSTPRNAYLESFTEWQKASKPKRPGDPHSMKIDFPLFTRPFELGSPEQSASRTIGQKRVGTMATFPPRVESLKCAIDSILPQLDELVIYLNNYDNVPDWLNSPKIRVIRSQHQPEGDLRDNGKFFSIPSGDECYVFTLDDDLIYPPDYVANMIHQIEMLGRSSVVGLHGVNFPEGEFTALDQRTIFFYAHEKPGCFVDLLGTGTTAWHSSTIQITLNDFLTKGVADLWFAVAAAKQEVPLFSVPRGKKWLKEYKRFEESLYREALSQPLAYFDTYNQHVAPALQNGRVRRQMETHLSQAFDGDTLEAAGIVLQEMPIEKAEVVVPFRRSLDIHGRRSGVGALPSGELHFHLVVNGWNCVDYVDNCLRSIALQNPGPYSYEVTLVDDGSDDGTYEKLAAAAILPNAKMIRIRHNTGPAHARHVAISNIFDADAIVVLVDMDDALEPHALRTVAERYRSNPCCLLTIGNWHDQKGKLNPQGFYSEKEIDEQRIREVELFNATHLRTFRRQLYNAVREEDLLDQNGDWLTTCTDVALMYALIDQCWSDEIEFIPDPIYRYTRQHSSGTLARFGKSHKLERLAWLKSKPPKPRLHASRTSRTTPLSSKPVLAART